MIIAFIVHNIKNMLDIVHSVVVSMLMDVADITECLLCDSYLSDLQIVTLNKIGEDLLNEFYLLSKVL